MARVLGLGNALMDIITPSASEALLQEVGLRKGTRAPIDIEELGRALAQIVGENHLEAVGGSSANIVRGLSRLGMGTGFIGKVGRDETGRSIRDAMNANGITPLLRDSIARSGHLIALITPDGVRTYGTFLGAAATLNASDLSPSDFQGYDLLHIEGYIVQNRSLLTRALALAREHLLRVSLDLSSARIVDRNREFLHRIIPQSVDIILTNQEGARAFTGQTPKNALYELSSMCGIAVIRMGHHGAMARRGEEVVYTPSFPACSVDGAGAGDLFTSGFLYGLLNGWNLASALDLGNFIASEVVQVHGTHLSEAAWQRIRERASRMAS